MRVEGPSTAALLQALLATRPAMTRAAEIPFDPKAATPPSFATPLATTPPASIAMLVALSAAQRPAEQRAEAVRAAAQGLDGLTDLHRDMIAGITSPQRLRALRDWAARRTRSDDPELEAVLSEVELRILVELAKRGEG